MTRVRYAPSPTGLQHIGGVRTALYDYLLARSSGGRFVLRIEDTDQQRYDERSLADIYETFSWLGFGWDEGPDVGGPYGPYVQTERRELYATSAQQLLDSGDAYYAYDSAEELRQQRERSDGKGGYDRKFRDMAADELASWADRGIAPVVRYKVPLSGEVTLRDAVLGEMSWKCEDIIADPVILKSDGLPTYHLGNVVDDHLMAITHVLRAQEWLSSAPLHLLLYRSFGWDAPQFCHLPMVIGEDGKKLGKRHGATRVLEFRERGYLPEALINYLARTGWSYDDKREIFTLQELSELFSLEKVSKAPAVFDYAKLEWLNGHYIREKTSAELYELVLPFLLRDGIVADPPRPNERRMLEQAMPLIQERLKYLSDAPKMVRFLFQGPGSYEVEELIPKKGDLAAARTCLTAAAELLPKIADHDDTDLEQLFRDKAAEIGQKLGNLLMPLRVAVTGSRVSPPLFESIRIIGTGRAAASVESAINRLNEAINAGE
jgi:glutamyl-tRNA synthetase